MKLIKGKEIFLIIISLLIIAMGCKKGITDAGDGERRIKTPREMTWTADTLTSPDPSGGQLMMENILVFSTNDVWVCGWNDVARGLIWHYDGNKWSESNIRDDVGGMRVNDIAGYSSNDLWACGYSGDNIFLAHYNGKHWTRENDMGVKGELLDMCKDPSGNIWACGRNGVILKYDKTKWIADTIKISFPYQAEYFLQSMDYNNGEIYLLASSININTLKEKYFFIHGLNKNWVVADSMLIDSPSSTIKWGTRRIYSSSSNQLYSAGLAGLWLYKNNVWVKSYDSHASLNFICGINEKYLIAGGDFCQIIYNDGNDWENIVDLFKTTDQYFVFRNSWTDGYETFIIGYGGSGTIIFHGK